MAIAFDSVASTAQLNTDPTTLSHVLGARVGSQRIVLGFHATRTSPSNGMTYNGVAMTSLTTTLNGSTAIAVYYMLDANLPAGGGTYTLSSTSGNGSRGVLACLSFTGVFQGAPTHTSANTTAIDYATAYIETLLLGAAAVATIITPSPVYTFTSSDSTMRVNKSDTGATSSVGLGIATRPTTSIGTYPQTITPSLLDNYRHIVLRLRPYVDPADANFFAFF